MKSESLPNAIPDRRVFSTAYACGASASTRLMDVQACSHLWGGCYCQQQNCPPACGDTLLACHPICDEGSRTWTWQNDIWYEGSMCLRIWCQTEMKIN